MMTNARKIAVLGAGREGLTALAWLQAREPSARFTVITEQEPEVGAAAAIPGDVELLVEPLNAQRLVRFDLLIRSPGISPYRAPLRDARRRGAQFTTATNLWFAAHPHARTLCITGTKGKSTTAALTAHLLVTCGYRVRLAGNIGAPLLGCPDDDVDWWVIELSSYQIADFEGRPDIAVILNLSPEHLDWHGSIENYLADKLRLADRVRSGGLVLNEADPELVARFGGRAGITWFGGSQGIHLAADGLADGPDRLPVAMPETLPGRHNRLNVAAALTAVRLAGADITVAAAAVAGFAGLPHRLQVLGVREGVEYVNDSIASTPVATAAALEALADRPVLLLVGGFDRGLDWNRHLADFVRHPPRAVIGVPDNGERIVRVLRTGGLRCEAGMHTASSLESAMRHLQELVRPGDTVLLSPGAPSFPRFKDYRDRGRRFANLAGFALPDE